MFTPKPTTALAPTAPGQEAAASGTAVPPEGIHPEAGMAPLPIPPGASPDQVALGGRIYHGQATGGTCVGCHAADGRGTATGANLVDNTWTWSDGSPQGIARTIESGVPHPKNTWAPCRRWMARSFPRRRSPQWRTMSGR
jgi:mono/diheme cytochrome c family protein